MVNHTNHVPTYKLISIVIHRLSTYKAYNIITAKKMNIVGMG